MKSATLQLVAWWSTQNDCSSLLYRLDEILWTNGFSIHSDPQIDRQRHGYIFGWDRVELSTEMANVWFALCPSVDGPWATVKLRCRKRQTVTRLESLFAAIIEQLQPLESVLVNSNADSFPCLAQAWCKGGLSGVVNLDNNPPVEHRSGQAGWFQAAGVERRYFASSLLERHAIDPAHFAAQRSQPFAPFANGFVFDGEWDALWHRKPAEERPIDWSDEWTDQDRADATAAAIRRFDDDNPSEPESSASQ